MYYIYKIIIKTAIRICNNQQIINFVATPDDENLECLCKLLTTVGQRLDVQMKKLEEENKTPETKIVDKFFTQLDKLANDKKISSRIRFAIMVRFLFITCLMY